jgi:hypothetical protein
MLTLLPPNITITMPWTEQFCSHCYYDFVFMTREENHHLAMVAFAQPHEETWYPESKRGSAVPFRSNGRQSHHYSATMVLLTFKLVGYQVP